MNNRFVDIGKLARAQELIGSTNPNHCKRCGDTCPEEGFYPMGMSGGTSMLLCNKCEREMRSKPVAVANG